MIAVWKERNLRIRVLGEIKGRFGETRFQVQKETAQGVHGIFYLKAEEITWPE